MNAKLVTIGDELLIGQVTDTNSAWLAAELELINIKVTEIRSIRDSHEVIVSTLEEMLGKIDVIIITGGLGPTKDDVTKIAIADFLGVDLVFHEESYLHLTNLLQKFNIKIKESHKSQAYVPRGCKVLFNGMGTAQGMWMEKSNTIIISTPGVPYEMKYIMENGGFEALSKLNSGQRIYHRTIMTSGWGETMIEEKIEDIVTSLPPHIKVAYLPGLGSVRVRISSLSNVENGREADHYTELIAHRLGGIVYGYDDEKMQEVVGAMLKKRGLKLGTAESCTGGYLAHLITSISGSSSYFEGSIISYSNDIKMNILSVKAETLAQYGAVSKETVKEMVNGAISSLNVDIVIATSGIAGPTGGTDEKPVGTIWIACGSKNRVITRKLQLTKDRIKNIEYTANAGLNMLRKFLNAQ